MRGFSDIMKVSKYFVKDVKIFLKSLDYDAKIEGVEM